MAEPVRFDSGKGHARRGDFRTLLFIGGSAAGFALLLLAANMSEIVSGAWTNIVQAIGRPAVSPHAGGIIAGHASVIDGDTIEIEGTRIRLHGIDAPENGQSCQNVRGLEYSCGREAARALTALIQGRAVICDVLDHDQYGRSVSACSVGRVDINAALVASGWALAYRQYSTAYVDEERAASAQKFGLWQGTFTPPWDWRSDRSPPQFASDKSGGSNSRDCRIKGNINSRGERIFHMPGQRYYSETEINTARGERWFCSMSEAVAAGWRASRT